MIAVHVGLQILRRVQAKEVQIIRKINHSILIDVCIRIERERVERGLIRRVKITVHIEVQRYDILRVSDNCVPRGGRAAFIRASYPTIAIKVPEQSSREAARNNVARDLYIIGIDIAIAIEVKDFQLIIGRQTDCCSQQLDIIPRKTTVQVQIILGVADVKSSLPHLNVTFASGKPNLSTPREGSFVVCPPPHSVAASRKIAPVCPIDQLLISVQTLYFDEEQRASPTGPNVNSSREQIDHLLGGRPTIPSHVKGHVTTGAADRVVLGVVNTYVRHALNIKRACQSRSTNLRN